MATATERWEDLQKDDAGEATTATRAWDVIDASSEADALSASGVAARGETHPRDERLRVRRRRAVQVGYGVWVVSAEYDRGDTHEIEADPLDEPCQVTVQPGSYSQQVDFDADGNALLNSAMDPLDPPPSNDFTELKITIAKTQREYDLALALRYQGVINSDQVDIPNCGRVEPGQCLCVCVRPSEAISERTRRVSIITELVCRAGFKKDSDGIWDGFKWRFADVGFRAWINRAGLLQPAPITYLSGTRVTTAVRLNGHGAIVEDGTYRTDAGASPVSLVDSPRGATLEETEKAWFIKYNRRPRVSFAQLAQTWD